MCSNIVGINKHKDWHTEQHSLPWSDIWDTGDMPSLIYHMWNGVYASPGLLHEALFTCLPCSATWGTGHMPPHSVILGNRHMPPLSYNMSHWTNASLVLPYEALGTCLCWSAIWGTGQCLVSPGQPYDVLGTCTIWCTILGTWHCLSWTCTFYYILQHY